MEGALSFLYSEPLFGILVVAHLAFANHLWHVHELDAFRRGEGVRKKWVRFNDGMCSSIHKASIDLMRVSEKYYVSLFAKQFLITHASFGDEKAVMYESISVSATKALSRMQRVCASTPELLSICSALSPSGLIRTNSAVPPLWIVSRTTASHSFRTLGTRCPQPISRTTRLLLGSEATAVSAASSHSCHKENLCK